MKKLIYSLLLVGAIIVGCSVGNDDIKVTAIKEGDAGSIIITPMIFTE
ncbi:hypothetical protein SFC66_04250 [Terribacillus saccharophilus]